MKNFVPLVANRVWSEDGQDLLEYALLCGLIALVALVEVTAVGNQINTVLWQVIAASNI